MDIRRRMMLAGGKKKFSIDLISEAPNSSYEAGVRYCVITIKENENNIYYHATSSNYSFSNDIISFNGEITGGSMLTFDYRANYNNNTYAVLYLHINGVIICGGLSQYSYSMKIKSNIRIKCYTSNGGMNNHIYIDEIN